MKIGLVVGPKEEPGPRVHPASKGVEKARLKDPVLVMAELGPRIGKKDKNIRKARCRRQGVEKKSGFRLEEVQIGQPGAVALPNRPRDAIRGQIDAHAEFFRMRLRICRQKMPVSAADFPDEGTLLGRKYLFERGLERFASLRETLAMFDRAGGIVHGRTARDLVVGVQASRATMASR